MEKSTVEIDGQIIELEERVCICGCGIKFRVPPISKQQYARSACKHMRDAKMSKEAIRQMVYQCYPRKK